MTALRLRVLALLPLTALLATMLVFAGPASAAPYYCTSACTKTDPRNDAAAKADLLRGRFVAGPKAFNVRLKVRDLKRTGWFVFGGGLGGWGVNYRVVKTKNGARVTSRTISEVQVYPAKPCPSAGVAWNAKKNFVQVRLPYACAGSGGEDRIMNGVDFHMKRAVDHMGRVFYRP